MQSFEFYNPVKILFGPGQVSRIGEVSAQYGKKALIVSYQKIDFYGDLFDRIQKSLSENGVASVTHFAATPNPMISQAVSGVALGKVRLHWSDTPSSFSLRRFTWTSTVRESPK